MIKVLALLFLCLALVSAKRSSRILHGRTVSERDAQGVFGFVAHVNSCDGRGGCGDCTGSLIKHDRILLAANCLCGENRRIKVRFLMLQCILTALSRKMTQRVSYNFIIATDASVGKGERLSLLKYE